MNATSMATIRCLSASVLEMLGDLEDGEKLVLMPELDHQRRPSGWKILCGSQGWPIWPRSLSRPYFENTPVCEFKPTSSADDTPWSFGGIVDHITEAISMAGYSEAADTIRDVEALMVSEIKRGG